MPIRSLRLGSMRASNDRRSRCSNEEAAPYQWVDYVDQGHPSVIELEEWFQSLSPFARSHEQGTIDNLMEQAQKGKLWESNDAKTPIKPITSDPELFELRHTALNQPIRFYHAEPERYPNLLLALHRHIKKELPPQQDEVEFAIGRYRKRSA